MPVTITFRLNEEAEVREIALEELKARIASGEIGPKTLIRDRVLTNEEWWTLDNLNIFHKNSPTAHSAGEHLQKKQELAKQRERAQQRSFEQLGAYIHGALIDERFDLNELSEIGKEKDVCGVTRLFILRSFEPERIFTFIFGLKSTRIEVAQGRTSLWYSLPQVGSVNGVWTESAGTLFDPAQIRRASTEVRLQDAPEPFKRWQDVVAATQLAPSCSSQVLDGVTFRHQLSSAIESLAAGWHNPNPVDHAAQDNLVKAYHDFIKVAKLDHFWQGRSL